MTTRKLLLLVLLIVSMLALQGCSESGPEYELITGEIFRDNFESEVLAEHWIVGPEKEHRRDGKWSLTANPGYLTIITLPADVHQTANNPVNFFLFDVPYENFEVSTHILIQPEQDFEQAGLLLYDDWDNYARLARVHAFGSQAVEPALETNAAYSEWIQNIDNTPEIYLRMTKIDDQLSYYYSVEGEDWIEVGPHPYVRWENTYAVLYAISPVSEREIDALFDYIEVKELKWVEVEK